MPLLDECVPAVLSIMDYPTSVSFAAERYDAQLKIPVISHNGIGTRESPLRLTMILRHADMADESTPQEAHERAWGTSRIIDEALSQVPFDESSSGEVVLKLKELLGKVRFTAQTDTYYSAAVTILGGGRFVAAGTGHVNLWRWSEGILTGLIRPSIIKLAQPSSKGYILASALGLGFAPEKVQTCDVSLEPLDHLVLALECVQDLDDQHRISLESIYSSRELLNEVTTQIQVKPALLAVIGPAG